MDKKHKTYTLMLITPATSARFYRLMLTHRQLHMLVTTCAMSVLISVGFLIGYYHIRKDHQALQEKHARMVNDVWSRLSSVQAESLQVRQIADEIGLILHQASLTNTKLVEEATGVGGPGELDSLLGELDRVALGIQVLRENLDTERTRLAATPVGWPTHGQMTSGFGLRVDPFGEGYEFHTGVDIGAEEGQPVRATADGVIIFADLRGSYGNLVVIEHSPDCRSFYGHLSGYDVSVGDQVRRGDLIGRVGQTGRTTAAHIHYEIRINDHPIDPRRLVSLIRDQSLDLSELVSFH